MPCGCIDSVSGFISKCLYKVSVTGLSIVKSPIQHINSCTRYWRAVYPTNCYTQYFRQIYSTTMAEKSDTPGATISEVGGEEIEKTAKQLKKAAKKEAKKAKFEKKMEDVKKKEQNDTSASEVSPL